MLLFFLTFRNFDMFIRIEQKSDSWSGTLLLSEFNFYDSNAITFIGRRVLFIRGVEGVVPVPIIGLVFRRVFGGRPYKWMAPRGLLSIGRQLPDSFSADNRIYSYFVCLILVIRWKSSDPSGTDPHQKASMHRSPAICEPMEKSDDLSQSFYGIIA